VAAFHVSRETEQDLKRYQALLLKWNRRINLISRTETEDIFRRHFEDSLQIIDYLPEDMHSLVDLGSGAGFPGLVLAMALKSRPELHVTLIESNGKKCAFLREAARSCGLSVTVLNTRIEQAAERLIKADVITSRALASLDKLLDLAYPLLAEGGICVFHKGQYVDDELTDASKYWNMSVEKRTSRTDPTGTILILRQLDPKRR